MAENKHTAGPWLDAEGFWLLEPNRLLANTEDALVMGRAPETLEALERIERYVLDTKYPSPSSVAEMARAAIARATAPTQEKEDG